jgi:two-component system response regulator HydG
VHPSNRRVRVWHRSCLYACMIQEDIAPVSGIARKNLSICVLDDDADHVELTTHRLEKSSFVATGTTDPNDALQQIRLGTCRVVLADLKMPRMDGMTFLEKALQFDPGIHVILMSGLYSVESAIAAVKRGAYDYLEKPMDYERLERTLDEIAENFARRSEIQHLEDKLFQNLNYKGIVGNSPAMIEVFELARKVAKHYTNVLVTGPTGAGKELVARALHDLSPVAQQRFAVCNCSALVDTLLESQLFGHTRGSFTGATDTRPGLFEYANGGTVFLDEVGETSLAMQAKLLRVIQNREIQRVGSPEVKKIDIRLVAATNRDLRVEVSAGRFREDLFYRLSSIEIRVPGLTERAEDVPVLVQHFLKKYAEAYHKPLRGLTRRAQTALLQHDWPGNVRELENVISSSSMTAGADFIDIGDLPPHIQKPRQTTPLSGNEWRPVPLNEIRRVHIERVLQACNGNRVKAAHMLGIGRTSLYRFLKRGGKRSTAAASLN